MEQLSGSKQQVEVTSCSYQVCFFVCMAACAYNVMNL